MATGRQRLRKSTNCSSCSRVPTGGQLAEYPEAKLSD